MKNNIYTLMNIQILIIHCRKLEFWDKMALKVLPTLYFVSTSNLQSFCVLLVEKLMIDWFISFFRWFLCLQWFTPFAMPTLFLGKKVVFSDEDYIFCCRAVFLSHYQEIKNCAAAKNVISATEKCNIHHPKRKLALVFDSI